MLSKAYIEITNFCGLNCDFCEPKKAKPMQMGLGLFETISRELQDKTQDIAYHMLGDPATVENLSDYLDISFKYGFRVHITTSGYYLDNKIASTLMHKAVKQVNFSLSSFYSNGKHNKQTLDEYLSKITAFAKKSIEKPKRFVNLRLWNIGNERYNDFNRNVETILIREFGEGSDFDAKKRRLAPYTMLVKDTMFSWPDIDKAELANTGSCHAVKGQLGFLVDGTVAPCCLDAKGVMRLGDIKTTPLEEILNSKRAIEMKRGFEQNILIEKMCRTCGFREMRL
ncbi:MAG: SPASM domain-containing protein [Campylobacteraceae bacterium]|jgi:radical SAM protein with 4Fe4S-binding SPASM domain|nr:SPASM domain-containing protein [Campylobacteraceae bacterium]